MESDDFTPFEVKKLLEDLEQFKTTILYKHYKDHFKALFDVTIRQVMSEPLRGMETLFTREAWIGEARSSELMLTWFEDLESRLLEKLREQKEN